MSCTSNFLMKNPRTGEIIKIPCRQCISCRLARSIEWQVRNRWESFTNNGFSYFVSLTFADDYLYNTDGSRVDLSVDLLQRFFKRFRKKLHNHPMKYFAVSEYGEKSGRPHYHFLLHAKGLSFGSVERAARESWRNGFISVEPFNATTCRYVVEYVTMFSPTPEDKEIYRSHGLTPPFSLKSRGIGFKYMSLYKDEIVNGCLNNKGFPFLLPSYWRNKLGLPPFEFDEYLISSLKLAKQYGVSPSFINEWKSKLKEQSNIASGISHGQLYSLDQKERSSFRLGSKAIEMANKL